MANTWDDAVKAAKKILGPKGKVPEPSQTVANSRQALFKAYEEFDAARKDLKAKFDAHQNKFDKYLGAVRANLDELKKDNLGLDPKIKEEEKKIVEARKPLVEYVAKGLKENETELAKFANLSRSVATIVSF